MSSRLDKLRSCLENLGSWLIGVVFALVGVGVLLSIPQAEAPLIVGMLGLLLLHTATLAIVGIALERATRFLAISWVVFLLAFLVVAAILYG